MEITSPSRQKKRKQSRKVASVGARHMSGLPREPCAWQQTAAPRPAPAFHSSCNSHKRLLKPKKNKTVILIKQHSGTLKTRWRLLRPASKLDSPLPKAALGARRWTDAGSLSPGSAARWESSRQSAGGNLCPHTQNASAMPSLSKATPKSEPGPLPAKPTFFPR